MVSHFFARKIDQNLVCKLSEVERFVLERPLFSDKTAGSVHHLIFEEALACALDGT